jgi:ParB family chromosome partitioning protein
VSKRGLPAGLSMRHDWHYVEELSKTQRTIGKIIPLDEIEPNPEQPRTETGDLNELTASIKEKGVLEPLLVKPLSNGGWMIIAGERRWRAARLAGLREVPCIELDLDAAQIAEIALIENLQRKDLTVWEEADGLQSLCQKFGYTHEDVARKIGKSRSTVTESLTIANLPLDVRQKCIESGINSKSSILQVARQFDQDSMLETIKFLTNNAKILDDKTNKTNEKKNTRKFNNGKKTYETTDLSTPVKAFSYQSEQGDFKLALKFKKPIGKTEIIQILREVLNNLEK